jgi:hypothetical protein
MEVDQIGVFQRLKGVSGGMAWNKSGAGEQARESEAATLPPRPPRAGQVVLAHDATHSLQFPQSTAISPPTATPNIEQLKR